MARGNLQSNPVDYTELYAPVVRIESVHTVLSRAVAKKWGIHQADVTRAFLYAPLPKLESVYVRLPNGDCVKSANWKRFLLQKSFHGLRQAPKLWYEHFRNTIPRIGFRRSMFSDCFFIWNLLQEKVFFVVYMDDLLIFGTDTGFKLAKKRLSEFFHDYRPQSLFIVPKNSAWKVPQWTRSIPEGIYRADYPEWWNSICKASQDPATSCASALRRAEAHNRIGEARGGSVPFLKSLGAPLYLCTRTSRDIGTAVSNLGKFQFDPEIRH